MLRSPSHFQANHTLTLFTLTYCARGGAVGITNHVNVNFNNFPYRCLIDSSLFLRRENADRDLWPLMNIAGTCLPISTNTNNY